MQTSPPSGPAGAELMTQIALEQVQAPAACCAPLLRAGISAGEAEVTASLFKALADPTRVRIVNLLANRSEAVCACEMNEEFDLAQPTMSHHLKKLVSAGLLTREQRGTWAYFSIDKEALQRLAEVVGPEKGRR